MFYLLNKIFVLIRNDESFVNLDRFDAKKNMNHSDVYIFYVNATTGQVHSRNAYGLHGNTEPGLNCIIIFKSKKKSLKFTFSK